MVVLGYSLGRSVEKGREKQEEAKSGIECLVQGLDIGCQRVYQHFIGPVYLRSC